MSVFTCLSLSVCRPLFVFIDQYDARKKKDITITYKGKENQSPNESASQSAIQPAQEQQQKRQFHGTNEKSYRCYVIRMNEREHIEHHSHPR